MDKTVIELKNVLRRLQGDKQLLAEIVEIFLADAPKRFKKVEQLMDQGDLDELADAAHALKGAASNIGAGKLWKSFCEMEVAAKEKDLDEAKKIFEEDGEEHEKVRKDKGGL